MNSTVLAEEHTQTLHEYTAHLDGKQVSTHTCTLSIKSNWHVFHRENFTNTNPHTHTCKHAHTYAPPPPPDSQGTTKNRAFNLKISLKLWIIFCNAAHHRLVISAVKAINCLNTRQRIRSWEDVSPLVEDGWLLNGFNHLLLRLGERTESEGTRRRAVSTIYCMYHCTFTTGISWRQRHPLTLDLSIR